MIEAVLFDMDGVLVDSEELIFLSAKKMFAEHGARVKREDFIPYIGTGEDSYLGNVAKKYLPDFNLKQGKARTYEIYDELAGEKLTILPGVKQFIEKCRKKKLKTAVATSADEPKMKVNIREMHVNNNAFDVMVNGLDVQRKKPHPDIYLETAKRLNVKPAYCLVVEDAITGVEAAIAAGARCLALTTSYPAEKLSKADWICSTLEDAPEESLEW